MRSTRKIAETGWVSDVFSHFQPSFSQNTPKFRGWKFAPKFRGWSVQNPLFYSVFRGPIKPWSPFPCFLGFPCFLPFCDFPCLWGAFSFFSRYFRGFPTRTARKIAEKSRKWGFKRWGLQQIGFGSWKTVPAVLVPLFTCCFPHLSCVCDCFKLIETWLTWDLGSASFGKV